MNNKFVRLWVLFGKLVYICLLKGIVRKLLFSCQVTKYEMNEILRKCFML